jgi:hypothetical protein
MTHKKAVAGFVFCFLTVSVAFAQNTVWPTQTATANVGIGVASTDAKLQVAVGSVFVSGDSGFLTSGGAGLALKYNAGGAQLFGYDYSATAPKSLILQGPGGNVGIGTTTASARLQVAGSAFIAGDSGSLSSDSGAGLGLKYSSSGAEVYGYNYTTSAPVSLLLQHFGGNVGINTATANYTLDVVGTIHATQVIGATYQDFAEWVPATEKMSPGTVVVVQRGAKNTVMPSGAAYATSVAGVVSEKPGVILGESSESKAMIATTGRVKVHVDASSGAIEAGDLLVTSGKPGMAMKSLPVDLGGVKIHRPGTLIGKALESLPSGEGDILVLLSLQ